MKGAMRSAAPDAVVLTAQRYHPSGPTPVLGVTNNYEIHEMQLRLVPWDIAMQNGSHCEVR